MSRFLAALLILMIIPACGDDQATAPNNDTMPDTESTVLKSGTFSGQNGYSTNGLVRVLRRADDSEVVETGADFSVDGGAGSISIWLTNAAGAQNLNQAGDSDKVKVGTITSGFSGVYSFDVPGDDSAAFTHAVAFCDGARANFGNASLADPQ